MSWDFAAFGLMEWLGLAALVSGIIFIVLSALRKRICWIFGALSCGILVYTLTEARFYVDALLNVYYVIMAFWGWLWWGRDSGNTPVRNERNILLLLGLFVLCAASAAVIGWGLHTFTDSVYPYPDALVGTLSITATWLSARKVIQNWWYWILADFMATYLYWQKDLYFESILLLIYAVVAIYGLWHWHRLYRVKHA